MRKLKSWAERQSRGQSVAWCVAALLVIAAADYVTGHEISMSLFYLGPVAFAAWQTGRTAGIAFAVLSSAAWFIADVAVYAGHSHPFIPVWNALIRLGFFLSGAWLTAALRQSINAAQHLARVDALTGIFNRRAFEGRLEHDLSLARRSRNPISIACIDVDGFKAVNDAHGHARGDDVLRIVGAVLNRFARSIDTPARLGGDEFGLVLPNTDSSGARSVMTRFSNEIETELPADCRGVSCSIGVVTVTGREESAADVLRIADGLMYEVKRSGKRGIAVRELDQFAPAE